jgi:hypothetical protein
VAGADLDRLAAALGRAGFDCGPPVAGGRQKPDGTMLRWTCLGVRNHGFGALVPFVIDWMDSPHPAGAAPRGGSL